MSKLGDIQNSYGKQISIAIANTNVSNLLNASNLPSNTIIISSPYDIITGDDLGTPAIVITDSYGEPVLLSKTLIPKNGLVYKDDSIELSINGTSIHQNENGQLYIDLEGLIYENSGLAIVDNKISIDATKLRKCSDLKYGLVSIDDSTISADNATLHINTNKLDHASNNIKGTVIGDGITLKITNGNPKVITSKLSKAIENYGVVKPDNTSLLCTNGVMSINKDFFISDNNFAVVKPDNICITSSNGVLSASLENAKKASDITSGVVKYNDSQFYTNENDSITINEYDYLTAIVNDVEIRAQIASEKVGELENEIANL